MDKFQNKYRVPSARLQNWDYGRNAAYFVTICTADREHYFGKIENEEMILSEIGKNAYECWLEIPEHFPFVKLDVHVVMPNHVHGIIVIDKQDAGRNDINKCNDGCNIERNVQTQQRTDVKFCVSTSQPKNKFGRNRKTLHPLSVDIKRV